MSDCSNSGKSENKAAQFNQPLPDMFFSTNRLPARLTMLLDAE